MASREVSVTSMGHVLPPRDTGVTITGRLSLRPSEDLTSLNPVTEQVTLTESAVLRCLGWTSKLAVVVPSPSRSTLNLNAQRRGACTGVHLGLHRSVEQFGKLHPFAPSHDGLLLRSHRQRLPQCDDRGGRRAPGESTPRGAAGGQRGHPGQPGPTGTGSTACTRPEYVVHAGTNNEHRPPYLEMPGPVHSVLCS